MDVNTDIIRPNYLYFGGSTPIRAYDFFKIQVEDNHPFPDLAIVSRRLQEYHPLYYPRTWLVYKDEAIVVDCDDVYECATGQRPPSPSPTSRRQPQTAWYVTDIYELIEEDSSIQQAIDESFEQAANHVPCSGLTNKFISKNLQVTKYCEEEEEGEICAVCQDEFRTKETVGVLHCKHRYHPECIKEWLVRDNACPLCKAQAFTV